MGAFAAEAPPDVEPGRLRPNTRVLAYDVPFVPTEEQVVSGLLRLAGVGPGDVFYDLGCGDGRLVMEAARRGAQAVGVEIDLVRVREAYHRAKQLGLNDRARFVRQDLFDVDLSPATVLMLYLLPSVNLRLRPKILWQCRPGTRVVCNYFDMGDWPADAIVTVNHRTLYKWVVPAWVGGVWRCVVNFPGGREHMTLRLRVVFQKVTGTASVGGREVALWGGSVAGDRFTFKLADPRRRDVLEYECRVQGKSLRGTCRVEAADDHHPTPWGGTWVGSAS
jgi:SAM-dependent methyltransferase